MFYILHSHGYTKSILNMVLRLPLPYLKVFKRAIAVKAVMSRWKKIVLVTAITQWSLPMVIKVVTLIWWAEIFRIATGDSFYVIYELLKAERQFFSSHFEAIHFPSKPNFIPFLISSIFSQVSLNFSQLPRLFKCY